MPAQERQRETPWPTRCEYNTRERANKYWPVILDYPQARKYATAIAYHGYDYNRHFRRAWKSS